MQPAVGEQAGCVLAPGGDKRSGWSKALGPAKFSDHRNLKISPKIRRFRARCRRFSNFSRLNFWFCRGFPCQSGSTCPGWKKEEKAWRQRIQGASSGSWRGVQSMEKKKKYKKKKRSLLGQGGKVAARGLARARGSRRAVCLETVGGGNLGLASAGMLTGPSGGAGG
ncbi:Hypothetical protein NTJ_06889 [Nesidiocoris tenuis]|uniref:Uncharacterized protein n=1 Tax=Nesidiocoris tenuis TaxID=355587 RepID=A0ABN7AS01_9HEMI|nr:Hypothetical protein NTJ_06889 [Nesidiocoris tenuis]